MRAPLRRELREKLGALPPPPFTLADLEEAVEHLRRNNAVPTDGYYEFRPPRVEPGFHLRPYPHETVLASFYEGLTSFGDAIHAARPCLACGGVEGIHALGCPDPVPNVRFMLRGRSPLARLWDDRFVPSIGPRP